MPPAYLVAQMSVHDKATFDEYSRLASPSVSEYGGEIVISGNAKRQFLEGGDNALYFVMAIFPSYNKALAWYQSDAYAPLIAMRHTAAVGSVLLVEGVD